MGLYTHHINKLGLPAPKYGEKQIHYLKRVLLNGYILNTRICRFIGIGNLHSLISSLKKQHFPHTVEHLKVVDPYTGELPPHSVDVIWMTPEQILAFRQRDAQPKPSV